MEPPDSERKEEKLNHQLGSLCGPMSDPLLGAHWFSLGISGISVTLAKCWRKIIEGWF